MRAFCLFSLCVQARLGTPTLAELGREFAEDYIRLGPWQRHRTSLDDYENITEVNLRVRHGLVSAPARIMRPTAANAATPSADSQEARQKPGSRNMERRRERTSIIFPSIRGTAATVAKRTRRDDHPAPVERNLRSRKHHHQWRSPINGQVHSGRTSRRLWPRSDAEFKQLCR